MVNYKIMLLNINLWLFTKIRGWWILFVILDLYFALFFGIFFTISVELIRKLFSYAACTKVTNFLGHHFFFLDLLVLLWLMFFWVYFDVALRFLFVTSFLNKILHYFTPPLFDFYPAFQTLVLQIFAILAILTNLTFFQLISISPCSVF